MKNAIKIVALAGVVAVHAVLSMPTQSDAMPDEKMLKYRNSVMWSLAAHGIS